MARQQADIYAIAAQHGGIPAGEEHGKSGYQLTFSIAYLRDLAMDFAYLAGTDNYRSMDFAYLAGTDNFRSILDTVKTHNAREASLA